ncbi:MAG TPA: DUF748 domain-containing protein [Rhodoferax sp.]|nr:DUF748 domain-containing protein [Rhodoferax sp.]
MNALISLFLAWKRRIAWTVGSLLVVWAVAWLAVPGLVKSQVEAKGSEALGRKLTVGAIDFKPWSLELTINDLAIASADGATSQFKVARVYVDAELQSLLRLAPVVDAITVDAPQLQVTHLSAGHYDLDDIVARLNQPSKEPASAPLRFALHNLTLNGGEVDFTDRLNGTERKHLVRKLHVALPFLSSLASQREVNVTPRLAFELNGSAFDTAAEGTPFAQTRKGEATVRISQFDVTPYLPYLPKGLPLQLKAAVLDTDLRVAFEQQPRLAVSVKGSATVSSLDLAEAGGQDLLGVKSIHAVLADVRPLEQVVRLESLEIVAPELQVRRNRAGHINLDLATSVKSKNAPEIIAASASSTGATGQNDAKPATATPAQTAQPAWQVELARFALHKGAVHWTDDTLAPSAKRDVKDIELQVQAIQWPFTDKPATLEGSLAIPSGNKTAQFAFKGTGTDGAGSVEATLKDLPLGVAAPYVAQFLVPQVAGVLEAEVQALWKDGQVQLKLPRLALRDFALVADKTLAAESPAPLPRFKWLEITDAQADLTARTASVGKVALRAPSATVDRDAQGRWMFQRWLKTAPVADTPAPASATHAAAATPPWKVAVAEVALDDGAVSLNDRLPARPVMATISALKVLAKTLTLDGKKPAPLTVLARIKAGQTEPGTLKYSGTVMWDPVTVQGTLDALDIPAHAFAPYVADRLNIELLRADASVKGTVRYAATAGGPQVQLRMDAALEDFRSNSVQTTGGQGLPVGEELLSWKSLNVPGIEFDMVPGTALRVQVREAALTDFYARLLVSPQGRLNLQDLVKPAPADAGTVAAAPATAASAPVASAPATPAGPAPIITVGPVSLVHGKVLFSDRFIQPNYSADLSELTGRLSKFSSQSVDGVVQLADLELRGRAEGSASLEITGKVNPLARPLALDVRGKVRDLELPPLSPYAVKYAGYGIERGKLSVDVSYLIKPDGQLTATNSLVLNQLTFGDKVDGAPNSLPVKLAVSLLADRNGVIDLNLPISGSLNDPQFSIGPVIWKVITNLIAKALTSPFSLLASALGGSDELSNVSFAPGSSVLTADARQGLDKVAQALVDRPGLKVTVLGTASLEAEREALKRERLRGLLLAEKRRQAAVAGQDTVAVTAVTDAEYPTLLKEVYRRADITKPRNLVGFAKTLPAPEMEALLLASIGVNEDAMRELALSRGVAVRDYLAAKQLESERLFLGAAKTVPPQTDWRPRAELSLTSR